MRKLIIVIIIVFSFSNANAQSSIRDSVISLRMFGVNLGFYGCGGDLNERVKSTFSLGGSFIFKNKHNWLLGLDGAYFFSDRIGDEDVLAKMRTSSGAILGVDGRFADVREFFRGYQFNIMAGKILNVFEKPNPNSGILLMAGMGFVQHKIKIVDARNVVPLLADEYLKGYDRLSNGLMLHQSIGYLYTGNKKLINFYSVLDFYQGFTQGRRDYQFDLEAPDHDKRIDLMLGLRVGWILPFYKKAPEQFYLY
ncbi:MAG TPA: hypothetical protein PKH65_07360 [Bacteroidia bacterium]|nr:hypothetical protein [Bacteroidia bacterium]HNT80486.1 hypothetical protein [Bacteroidia bacterium]